MSRVLDVSTSGYYEWRQRPESKQNQSDRVLDCQIREVYDEHKQRYGVPRITDELRIVDGSVVKTAWLAVCKA